jgi:hypothetical protein
MQLKNYYELEKEKLEQKLVKEKEKYEKRLQELTEEHESKFKEEMGALYEDLEFAREEAAQMEHDLRDNF